MSIDSIISLLHRETGMDAGIIGEYSYECAIQKRMQQLAVAGPGEYFDLLQHSSEELGRLVDEIVVPETWFFRDRHAFDALLIALKKNSHEEAPPRRILSLPSSSGEEAYSIAITLFENGYTQNMFTIDAIDISQRNIDAAKRGLYRPNSFRHAIPDQIMQKYFIADGDQHKVCNKLKQAVSFRRASLFDAQTLNIKQHYDAVFCRNLLIYFNAREKKQAVSKLDAALKDQGILLIGHSESSLIPAHYTPCDTTRSFGFIKSAARADVSKPAHRKASSKPVSGYARHLKSANRPPATASTWKPQSKEQTAEPGVIDDKPAHSTLVQARELADAGQLEQALALILSDHDRIYTAECYTLLGTIYNASKNIEDAEQSFRKALFLDPNHYDALIQLALLLDNKGDSKNAQLLNKRAARSQQHRLNSGALHE